MHNELTGGHIHVLFNRFRKSPDGLYYFKIDLDDTSDGKVYGHLVGGDSINESTFFYQSVFINTPDTITTNDGGVVSISGFRAYSVGNILTGFAKDTALVIATSTA